MKILNITGILPSPAKPRENDIVLVTANSHEDRFEDVEHHFLFLLPYSNRILATLSNTWGEFFRLQRNRSYQLANKTIWVVGLLTLKSDFLRVSLYRLSYIVNYKRLTNLFTQIKPDIIHAHNTTACAFMAKKLSKKFNVPYLISARSIQSSYGKNLIADNLKNARGLISINHLQRRTINELLIHNNHITLPHGIDEAFFFEGRRLIEGNHPVKIITLCRLLPLKNLNLVLDALSQIEARFTYDIYGDGPEYERLLELVNKLGLKDKVKFHGFVEYSEVPELLTHYEIFIMPSYPETLGRVFFEAMAASIPVIGARGTGIDGFIEEGKNGYLVDHTDPNDLRGVLERLLNDRMLREKVGRAGQQLAKNYSASNVANQLDKMYRSILLE